MRRQVVLHLIGIILFVTYVLFLLSTVVRTILLDITPYALSKEELAVSGLRPHDYGATFIPKIIHQVYLGFDNKVMPLEWEEARQSCIDLHPNYEYKVRIMIACETFYAETLPAMDERVGGRSAYERIPLVSRNLDQLPIPYSTRGFNQILHPGTPRRYLH